MWSSATIISWIAGKKEDSEESEEDESDGGEGVTENTVESDDVTDRKPDDVTDRKPGDVTDNKSNDVTNISPRRENVTETHSDSETEQKRDSDVQGESWYQSGNLYLIYLKCSLVMEKSLSELLALIIWRIVHTVYCEISFLNVN